MCYHFPDVGCELKLCKAKYKDLIPFYNMLEKVNPHAKLSFEHPYKSNMATAKHMLAKHVSKITQVVFIHKEQDGWRLSISYYQWIQ